MREEKKTKKGGMWSVGLRKHDRGGPVKWKGRGPNKEMKERRKEKQKSGEIEAMRMERKEGRREKIQERRKIRKR